MLEKVSGPFMLSAAVTLCEGQTETMARIAINKYFLMFVFGFHVFVNGPEHAVNELAGTFPAEALPHFDSLVNSYFRRSIFSHHQFVMPKRNTLRSIIVIWLIGHSGAVSTIILSNS